jgi:hypothetical protein
MNIIKTFNQYSLYALLILVVLPSIYFLLPKIFNSYFDALDKFSIPLWAGLYAFFWLKFNKQIKKTERQILIYKDRTASFERTGNKQYFQNYKSDTTQFPNLERELSELKIHFDFVNESLWVAVILSAIIKIIQLIWSIII